MRCATYSMCEIQSFRLNMKKKCRISHFLKKIWLQAAKIALEVRI